LASVFACILKLLLSTSRPIGPVACVLVSLACTESWPRHQRRSRGPPTPKRLAYRIRFPRDNVQIGPGRSIRLLAALLPITNRADRDVEGVGEFPLAQLQGSPDGAHPRYTGCSRPFLIGHGTVIRVGLCRGPALLGRDRIGAAPVDLRYALSCFLHGNVGGSRRPIFSGLARWATWASATGSSRVSCPPVVGTCRAWDSSAMVRFGNRYVTAARSACSVVPVEIKRVIAVVTGVVSSMLVQILLQCATLTVSLPANSVPVSVRYCGDR